MLALFHNIRALKSLDIAEAALRFCMPPKLTFDVIVVSFGAGIASYFALGSEIYVRVMIFLFAITTLTLWMSRNTDKSIWIWGVVVWAMLAGLGRASWHTHMKNPVTLPSYEKGYDVKGWIKSVSPSGKGIRWHIVIQDFDGVSEKHRPKIIRVRLGQKYRNIALVGDSVSLKAILSAPPGPAVPQGYSPAKRAFFEQVGGFGYAISTPLVTSMNDVEPNDVTVVRKWAQFRYALAERIVEASPENTAGLQAALLTGVRYYIAEDQTEALRAAGLAHILAISGLHMGLLAGTAYYVFTLILVLFAPLSRRFDVRKFSAGLAIIAATAYLLVSGASVATQRAYIMAIIVFCAIILDRRALSIRSVSVAAFITLFLHPEALTSVGFQMSFAAVLALVVVYRFLYEHRPKVSQTGIAVSFRNNLMSLSVTSLVAGAATAGFALFHFGRVAKYGLAGNLLAMPVFTFGVMPLGIVSLLAIPFGLEEWPLAFMGYAVSKLVLISEWIASWEGAMVHAKAAPQWVIALYGLAFILLLLGKVRGRAIAFVLVSLSALGWALNPIPDIRISAEGRVAFWETQDYQRLIVTSKRADNYGRNQFSEKAGHIDPDIIAIEKTNVPCDSLGCRFEIKGLSVSILNHPSEARIECMSSALVILTQRDVGPEVRRNCKAHLIDGRVLREQGSMDIYLSRTGIIKQIGTKKPISKRRPWEY